VISMVPSGLVPRLLPCGLGTRLDDIKLNGQGNVCYSTLTVAVIIKHLPLALFHTTVGNMQECLAKIIPCVANSSCSRCSLHCAIYSMKNAICGMKPCKVKVPTCALIYVMCLLCCIFPDPRKYSFRQSSQYALQ